MSFLIGKFYYLVLDRRAVSGTGSLDSPGEQWRTIQIGPDDLMCLLVRVSKPAGYLILLYGFRICGKRERYNPLITQLFLHPGEIDASFIHSGRGPCLKTKHLHPVGFQGICQMGGRLKAVGTCRIADIPVDTSGIQISSCSQNHCPAVIHGAGQGFYSLYLPGLHQNLRHLRLSYGQMVRVLQGFSHLPRIFLFIGLSSQGVYGRTF